VVRFNLHVHAVVRQSRLCPPLPLEIYVEKKPRPDST
jgi:hypothetical protein